MGNHGIHLAGTRISQCSACETPLPLCVAANPEDVRVWACSQCGAEFHAMLSPDCSMDELRGVRHEPVVFDPQLIRPVAPGMLGFAQHLAAQGDTHVERRSAPRRAVIATVNAMEFDSQLRPVGPPFHTICRNLSANGICLIHDREIRSNFLVIELSATRGTLIQTLARLLRRRLLGPYQDIGCEFVTKLTSAPGGVLKQS